MVGCSLQGELIIDRRGASNIEQINFTEDSTNTYVVNRCKSRMHHAECVSSLT